MESGHYVPDSLANEHKNLFSDGFVADQLQDGLPLADG
jgi:hypothetical protein